MIKEKMKEIFNIDRNNKLTQNATKKMTDNFIFDEVDNKFTKESHLLFILNVKTSVSI